MPSLELRPRSATEIVDAAFQLYRGHFADLVSLSALVFAPYVLLMILVAGGEPITPDQGAGVMLFVTLLAWILGSLMEAAVVVAVSNSYLHGEPDTAGALRYTLSRLGRVLLAVTAKWFMISFMFMLALTISFFVSMIGLVASDAATADGSALAVAGIMLIIMLLSLPVALYFFARYFAVPATVVLEGRGVFAGMRRSAELSRGFKMKVLGALGVTMILFVSLQLFVVGMLEMLPGPALLRFLLEQAWTILVYPIVAVIATLLYYDARIRKEGFDIAVMAAELGEGDAASHATT